ncbi:MAG TPA: futalosine hydrolase [Puia sp.]|nr:futalosine hydrolase [Puia sp.]
MHILLAAATTFEIQPALDYLPALGPHRISSLITGVGGLPASVSLMRQIDRDRPDLLIQAGIAGSFNQSAPGQVVVVRDETLADLGVWEEGRFRSLFALGLADANQPPFCFGRLVNPHRALLELTGLEPVSAITVNEISTQPDRIAWYRQNTSAAVESLEGGALHYICLQERIPFLQLRSVSNGVGIRDKSKWDIPLAIGRLNDRLIVLLQELDRRDDSILNPVNDIS